MEGGALWELQVPVPSAEPELDPEVLTGDLSSYRACEEEAHRLREAGHSSLRAPSAALLLGHAEVSCVVGGAQGATGHPPSHRSAGLRCSHSGLLQRRGLCIALPCSV